MATRTILRGRGTLLNAVCQPSGSSRSFSSLELGPTSTVPDSLNSSCSAGLASLNSESKKEDNPSLTGNDKLQFITSVGHLRTDLGGNSRRPYYGSSLGAKWLSHSLRHSSTAAGGQPEFRGGSEGDEKKVVTVKKDPSPEDCDQAVEGLTRTAADIFGLLPFADLILVPFMEFLLPVFLKLFPNMLPSTFQDKKKEQEDLKRKLNARVEYAKFLQETVKLMANEVKNLRSGEINQTAEDLDESMNKVRRDEDVSNEEILGFAKLFELKLDNISWPHLVNICKYMGIGLCETDADFRCMLRSKLQKIKEDDKRIQAVGLDSLSEAELRQACGDRGLLGLLTVEEMRQQLLVWLELSLNHSVPSSVQIMSRAFNVSVKIEPEEVVEFPVSSLSDKEEEEKRKAEEERANLCELLNQIPGSLCELTRVLDVLASACSMTMVNEEFLRFVRNKVESYNAREGENEAYTLHRAAQEFFLEHVGSEAFRLVASSEDVAYDTVPCHFKLVYTSVGASMLMYNTPQLATKLPVSFFTVHGFWPVGTRAASQPPNIVVEMDLYSLILLRQMWPRLLQGRTIVTFKEDTYVLNFDATSLPHQWRGKGIHSGFTLLQYSFLTVQLAHDYEVNLYMEEFYRVVTTKGLVVAGREVSQIFVYAVLGSVLIDELKKIIGHYPEIKCIFFSRLWVLAEIRLQFMRKMNIETDDLTLVNSGKNTRLVGQYQHVKVQASDHIYICLSVIKSD